MVVKIYIVRCVAVIFTFVLNWWFGYGTRFGYLCGVCCFPGCELRWYRCSLGLGFYCWFLVDCVYFNVVFMLLSVVFEFVCAVEFGITFYNLVMFASAGFSWVD